MASSTATVDVNCNMPVGGYVRDLYFGAPITEGVMRDAWKYFQTIGNEQECKGELVLWKYYASDIHQSFIDWITNDASGLRIIAPDRHEYHFIKNSTLSGRTRRAVHVRTTVDHYERYIRMFRPSPLPDAVVLLVNYYDTTERRDRTCTVLRTITEMRKNKDETHHRMLALWKTFCDF